MRNAPRGNAAPPLWFGAIFAAVGAVVLTIGLVLTVRAIRSSSWPAAPGTVTASEVVRTPGNADSPDSFHAAITYRYAVAGRDYTADRVRFGSVGSSGRTGADRLVARYPVGAAVRVHYAPGDPAVAVLEPGLHPGLLLFPCLGGLFGAVGAVMVAVALKARARRRLEARAFDERAAETAPRTIDAGAIADPPADLGLRLRRRGDSIVVTGTTAASGSMTAAGRAVVGCWTVAVGLLLTLGLVFCVGMLALVLSGGPMKINGRPASKAAGVAFVVGFGVVWALIGGLMLRGGRRSRSLTAGVLPWTLAIDDRRVIATVEAPDGPIDRRFALADLRGFQADASGTLRALPGDPTAADPGDRTLVGPLAPAAASWLADALNRATGLGS